MTVLAFDQSTTITGWCVFKDGEYVKSGLINCEHIKKDSAKRINLMIDSICEYINAIKPDKVVIEDIFDKNNIQTVILLARLQGMIQFYCHQNSLLLEILSPTTWRSRVGIHSRKRAAAKEEAINLITNLYQLDVENDEAEAVCIAAAASNPIK